MSFTTLAHWLSLLGNKNHNVLTLDKVGNLALFDEDPEDDPDCRIMVNWENIRVSNPVQHAKISSLIQACICYDETKDSPLPRPVRLEAELGSTIYIDAVPIPRKLRKRLNGVCSLLYFRKVEFASDFSMELLQKKFHLTPAEASVAIMLSEGSSLKIASSQLHISIWTVRSHLRSIFQKTDTHRQAELVSKLTRVSN